MEQLCYETLEKAGYTGYLLKNAPERVLQFGEGNFLRAFADYWFDMANEKAGWNGKCVLVQPIAQGLTQLINRQEGLYTLYLRGRQNGEEVDAKRVISCVHDCVCPYSEGKWDEVLALARSKDLEIVVSNTTEAGIAYTQGDSQFDQVPPNSFPAKLTRVLYERYTAFKGAADKGLIILSCELIDNNGKELQKCCNNYAKDWNLDAAFIDWMNNANTFCSTLVDRIVPGRIRDPKEMAALEEANGYTDKALDVGEVFGVWVIEGPDGLEDKLPFKKAGVNVMVVPDVTPYKKRKVRILNGAHTGFVLGAYLAGFDIVRDCMHDETIRGFMNTMLYDEVIPTLAADLDVEDCKAFAAAVENRFDNPFIDHALLSICLNSTAKWRARDLPTLKDYVAETGNLPKCLATSLATLISFYTQELVSREGDGLHLRRSDGTEYTAQDDAFVLDFYAAHAGADDAQLVHDVLTNEQMWGEDLTQIAGLEEFVVSALAVVRAEGAKQAFANARA